MSFLVGFAFSLLAQAGASAPSAYQPASTVVAVLPVANVSGFTEEPAATQIKDVVGKELRKQLTERGFKILDDFPVKDSVAKLKLDFDDVEQEKKDNIRRVGKESGADLVALVAVTDVSSVTEGGWLFSGTKGTAKVMVWLLDCNSDKSLMAGLVSESDHDNAYLRAAGGQVRKVAIESAEAVKRAFDRGLSTYPILANKGKTSQK